MVQGVRQVPPRDDRASAPGGFDWISSSVGVGLGLNASKLGMVEDDPQAASPKAQITAVKAQSNFMSAFSRRCTSLRRAASSMPQLRRRKAHQSRRRSRPTRCAPPGWSAIRRPTSQQKCHHDTLPTRECMFRNRRFRAFWGHRSHGSSISTACGAPTTDGVVVACDHVALRRRQGVEPKQLRHRRRARTPGAPQAKDQRADRGQRMAVNGRQSIARPAIPSETLSRPSRD
jgi:hypothetical protein